MVNTVQVARKESGGFTVSLKKTTTTTKKPIQDVSQNESDIQGDTDALCVCMYIYPIHIFIADPVVPTINYGDCQSTTAASTDDSKSDACNNTSCHCA